MGQHIDVTPFSLAEYMGFKEGGVRAIAYLAPERHPDLPEVPTALESGFEVVMPHVHYWWAPKGTPDAIVNRLADVLEAAMQTDYLKGKLAESKTEPLFLRGEELEQHLAERDGEFRDVGLVAYQGLPDPVIPVLSLVVLLSAGLIFRWWKKRIAGNGPPIMWRHGVGSCAVLVVYILLMQVVGLSYIVATIIFIPALAYVFGARSGKSSSIWRISLISRSTPRIPPPSISTRTPVSWNGRAAPPGTAVHWIRWSSLPPPV